MMRRNASKLRRILQGNTESCEREIQRHSESPPMTGKSMEIVCLQAKNRANELLIAQLEDEADFLRNRRLEIETPQCQQFDCCPLLQPTKLQLVTERDDLLCLVKRLREEIACLEEQLATKDSCRQVDEMRRRSDAENLETLANLRCVTERLKVAINQNQSGKAAIEILERDKSALSRQLDDCRSKAKEFELQNNCYSTDLNRLRSSDQQLKKQLELSECLQGDLRNRLAAQENVTIRLETEINQLQNKLVAKDGEKNSLSNLLEANVDKSVRLIEELSAAKNNNSALRDSLLNVNTKLSSAEDSLKSKDRDLQECRREMSRLSEHAAAKERQCHDLTERCRRICREAADQKLIQVTEEANALRLELERRHGQIHQLESEVRQARSQAELDLANSDQKRVNLMEKLEQATKERECLLRDLQSIRDHCGQLEIDLDQARRQAASCDEEHNSVICELRHQLAENERLLDLERLNSSAAAKTNHTALSRFERAVEQLRIAKRKCHDHVAEMATLRTRLRHCEAKLEQPRRFHISRQRSCRISMTRNRFHHSASCHVRQQSPERSSPTSLVRRSTSVNASFVDTRQISVIERVEIAEQLRRQSVDAHLANKHLLNERERAIEALGRCDEEVRRLTAKLKCLEQERDEMANELRNIKADHAAIQDRLRACGVQCEERKIALETEERNQVTLTLQLTDCRAKVENLELQNRCLEGDIHRLRADADRLRSLNHQLQVEKAESSVDQLRSRLAAKEAALASCREREMAQNKRFSDLESVKARLETEIEHCRANSIELAREKELLKNADEEKAQRIAFLNKEMAVTNNASAKLRESLVDSQTKLTEAHENWKTKECDFGLVQRQLDAAVFQVNASRAELDNSRHEWSRLQEEFSREKMTLVAEKSGILRERDDVKRQAQEMCCENQRLKDMLASKERERHELDDQYRRAVNEAEMAKQQVTRINDQSNCFKKEVDLRQAEINRFRERIILLEQESRQAIENVHQAEATSANCDRKRAALQEELRQAAAAREITLRELQNIRDHGTQLEKERDQFRRQLASNESDLADAKRLEHELSAELERLKQQKLSDLERILQLEIQHQNATETSAQKVNCLTEENNALRISSAENTRLQDQVKLFELEARQNSRRINEAELALENCNRQRASLEGKLRQADCERENLRRDLEAVQEHRDQLQRDFASKEAELVACERVSVELRSEVELVRSQISIGIEHFRNLERQHRQAAEVADQLTQDSELREAELSRLRREADKAVQSAQECEQALSNCDQQRLVLEKKLFRACTEREGLMRDLQAVRDLSDKCFRQQMTAAVEDTQRANVCDLSSFDCLADLTSVRSQLRNCEGELNRVRRSHSPSYRKIYRRRSSRPLLASRQAHHSACRCLSDSEQF